VRVPKQGLSSIVHPQSQHPNALAEGQFMDTSSDDSDDDLYHSLHESESDADLTPDVRIY